MIQMVDEYLKSWTGKDTAWWMDLIGQEIAKCAVPIPDTELAWCNPSDWVLAVSRELQRKTTHKMPPGSDENMFHATIISIVLSLWWVRVGRAKSYDNRRRPEDRRRQMKVVTANLLTLFACLVDESRDHEYFPKQKWECPFPTMATYKPDKMEKARQDYTKARKKGRKR